MLGNNDSTPPGDADPPGEAGHDRNDDRADSQHPADRTSGRRDRVVMLRIAGLGLKLASSTLVFAGIGYLVDSFFQLEKSYAMAGGALIGFALGMIRFIQQALKAADDSSS